MRGLHYVRAGWTAICGIAALLLLALWARSYWQLDGVGWGSSTASWTLSSQIGVITASKLFEPNGSFVGSRPVEDPAEWRALLAVNWWDERPQMVSLVFPHWLLALVIGLGGVLPWAPRQYRVRSLLIVTTAFAMMLGVLVYFSR